MTDPSHQEHLNIIQKVAFLNSLQQINKLLVIQFINSILAILHLLVIRHGWLLLGILRVANDAPSRLFFLLTKAKGYHGD